ncbi:RHS repeat domain-containing protein [Reyranella sp.]|uniref:RHS repeat domain-containing protein n=1 Tax=Reyranella sp. TaxID=1929291 RepID=UPI00273008F7|nr:RHS repeat domain-containing protein [Reyranella sp.]MDP2376662.1 RHS repeat domain-containing protein [Reyranella sp.]
MSYNGSKQLSSVSDNALPGRSVGYTYDGAGNLSAFNDPLGNVTTFAYTAAGDVGPPGLLKQIFYPSSAGLPFVTNTYDSLGRVAAQENAIGGVWNYFLAGYRSEENDPYGTQSSPHWRIVTRPVVVEPTGLRIDSLGRDAVRRLSWRQLRPDASALG